MGSDGGHWYTASIGIELESPFLIQGLEVRQFGIDTAQMRDHLHRPIIPDTEIKGVLRHALEVMDDNGVDTADLRARRFGKADAAKGRMDRIIFSDCVAKEQKASAVVSRIAIDETTGSVKPGHLQRIELIVGIGQGVMFTGTIRFAARHAKEAKGITDTLRKALDLVHAIGAFKTVGFGCITKRDVGAPVQGHSLLPSEPLDTPDFTLGFGLDRPFVVDSDIIDGNVFLGQPVIPGSVLKGTLAACLARCGLLHDPNVAAVLSEIVIGHAFPYLDGGEVDPAVPLCIYEVRTDNGFEYHDATQAGEWDARPASDQPAFLPDWKSGLGSRIERESRTHIEIKRDTIAAKDSALFSYVAVSPTIGGEPVEWRSRVVWPETQDPARCKALGIVSAMLRDGLCGIGKTFACMERVRVVDTKRPPEPEVGRRVRVVLRTTCLMLRCDACADQTSFHNALFAYWDTVSDSALALEKDEDGQPAVFAQQRLVGGYEMIRHAPFGEDRLEPMVLFAPGSVFVLEIRDPEKARRLLSDWARRGLPSIANVDWQKNPFVPENGYGTIEIDPDLDRWLRRSS